METAVFGGGCFWCTEAVFLRLKGVTSVTPGYAGGTMKNPGYYDVTEGTTGHAEVIKLEFDPSIISYDILLEVFWATHDPTTLNKQGNDSGTQYRSIILYTTDEQKKLAEASIKKNQPQFGNNIVTELKKLDEFYTAEEYHKKYFDRNPQEMYCQLVISPKINKLLSKFPQLVKEPS